MDEVAHNLFDLNHASHKCFDFPNSGNLDVVGAFLTFLLLTGRTMNSRKSLPHGDDGVENFHVPKQRQGRKRHNGGEERRKSKNDRDFKRGRNHDDDQDDSFED
jgi:hypothetical protein